MVGLITANVSDKTAPKLEVNEKQKEEECVNSDDDVNNNQLKDNERQQQLLRRRRRSSLYYRIIKIVLSTLLVLSYCIGILWHYIGHVNYSICTGDFTNPRKFYIDENSLDPNHFQFYNQYRYIDYYNDIYLYRNNNNNNKKGKNSSSNSVRKTISNPLLFESTTKITSLCHGVQLLNRNHDIRIPCVQIPSSSSSTGRGGGSSSSSTTTRMKLEMVKIVPQAAGILPINEAIVFVIPSFVPINLDFSNWKHYHSNSNNIHLDMNQIQFQISILQFIYRLALPTISPWLSKTIFIVSPHSIENVDSTTTTINTTTNIEMINPTLENTVRTFLNLYLDDGEEDDPAEIITTTMKSQQQKRTVPMVPLDYLGYMIRQIIVIDYDLGWNDITKSSGSRSTTNSQQQVDLGEIRILPHGRRGILPNMDLVFLCKVIYDKSIMVTQLQPITNGNNKNKQQQQQRTMIDLVVHIYHRSIQAHLLRMKEPIKTLQIQYPILDKYSSSLSTILLWYNNILQLLAFESMLAIGPYPPHSPALERGIDAITIQGSFANIVNYDNNDDPNIIYNRNRIPKSRLLPQYYPMEFVQRLELVVRSLSNLHERLHHSTSLYLLVSKDRFVKHEEFLIPNILLILPLLVRAILYIIGSNDASKDDDKSSSHDTDATRTFTDNGDREIERSNIKFDYRYLFNLYTIVQAVLIAFIWTIIVSILIDVHLEQQITVIYVAVIAILAVLSNRGTVLYNQYYQSDQQQFLQFVTCLLTTYIHVAIAFGHVSLSYPSALLWTPLIAFPSYRRPRMPKDDVQRSRKHPITGFFSSGIFLITCPFTYLVPHVFPTYTPYIRFVYVPLHMLHSILNIIPAIVNIFQYK